MGEALLRKSILSLVLLRVLLAVPLTLDTSFAVALIIIFIIITTTSPD